jgi:hypothetical protein
METMKKNTALKNIKAALSEQFCVQWEDGNVISVQLDSDSPVIAFIMYDSGYPNSVIFSMAQEFPDPFIISHIIITASQLSKLHLGECFYISDAGEIHWGAAAANEYVNDNQVDNGLLANVECYSKLIN